MQQMTITKNRWSAMAIIGSILIGGGVATTASAATATCPTSFTPLTQPEVDEALYMREEEKVARDVYLGLSSFWQSQVGDVPVVTIMSNIAQSEQTHMNKMAEVLACYGLTDPVDSAETQGVFLNPKLAELYQTLVAQGQQGQLEALKVGGLIEEVDMIDLQHSIDLSQQAYTDSVYADLMCGSRNHLRSFAGQIKLMTGTYTAQVLPQSEVDAIVNSPMEKCGH